MKRKYVSVRMNYDDYHKLTKLRDNEKDNIIKHSSVTDYIGYLITLRRECKECKKYGSCFTHLKENEAIDC